MNTSQKGVECLRILGELESLTPAAKMLISLGIEAIAAKEAFLETGDRSILYAFAEKHKIDPAQLLQGDKELCDMSLTEEERNCVSKLYETIEEIDLRAADLDLPPLDMDLQAPSSLSNDRPLYIPSKVLECSSRGDRRFSALFAKVTIKGQERSIEDWYQDAKRTADGKRAGNGKLFNHIVDPYTGDTLPAKEACWLYRGLWISYLTRNPELVRYAEQFDAFSDMFRDKSTVNCQAEVIETYVKGDREHYVAAVKRSDWYKNIVTKMKRK